MVTVGNELVLVGADHNEPDEGSEEVAPALEGEHGW
jgi:hypothetical protein